MRQRHSSIRFDPPRRPEHKTRPREIGRPGWLGFIRKLFWNWWLWVAAAFVAEAVGRGHLAIVFGAAGFVFYLLAPREHIPHYGLDHKFPIQSHEFLASIVGATGAPFIAGNKVTILNNGDEFYPAMLDAIASAKKTITMETYIFWAGGIGGRFAEALAERARAEVAVKLLLDSFGSLSLGQEMMNVLKESGCEVAWYNRMWPRTIGRFNHRDHRKSLVVDGRIAFTGGAGIADQWTGNAEDPAHWRDIQIRVEGPAAAPLQTGFAHNWLETTGELISGSNYFPPADSAGATAVQPVFSSPKSGSSAIRIMYDLSISAAEKRIYIANPYFVPDDSLVQILIDASRRGVDVKIMVAGIHNDMRISRYASIHLYGRLLQGGVKVYEYNRTMLHQKTMVVDATWATVGTTNIDSRSFALDEESNICVNDRRIAEKLEAGFEDDLHYCDQVTLDEWLRRGLKTRVYGEVCVFLKEQI